MAGKQMTIIGSIIDDSTFHVNNVDHLLAAGLQEALNLPE
jgi:hypothetical protein